MSGGALKGDWVFIAFIVLVATLFPAAMGFDWVAAALHVIAHWLMALPSPTKEWATIFAAWAWPSAALIIAYLFRRPLLIAAHHLARRFRKDRIKLWNAFEINAATELIPLNEADRDHQIIERMWEFAGASEENWNGLLSWIKQHIAAGVEIEDFLSERIFTPERELAYTELVEGH